MSQQPGVRCANMNHGRTNPPIKFCPMCGDSLNRSAVGRCDPSRHAGMRKQRALFCHDCGLKLAGGG